MPKILFIVQLPPPVHGAALVNETIYNSEKINNRFHCDYVNLTTAKDIHDIGKNGINKYWRSVLIYCKVLMKVLKHDYSLIYMTLSPHGKAFYKDGALALLLKLFGCKLVFHLHGKGIKRNIEKSRFKEWLYRLVFKNVNVIHLSKLLYFDIEKLCSADKVSYLPNGIPLNNHFKIENKPNKGRILYLSNMQESKGSFTLLQAVKLLKDKGVQCQVDFVGKWHNDNNFKKKWLTYYTENNLEKFVTYHGPKYNQEKEKYLIEANIFVLPTNNDCFPLSILEAMSYGNVVISTNQGAIPEIIENNHNGYILINNTPEILSIKLYEILIDASLKQDLAINGLNKVQKLYSNKQFERDFCLILDSIIKSNLN